ncbi:hypothetical protein [Sandarakinorhabdus oryzae]|uniref:hypothetical protein n=1 Tax=Sandarakinorhabdus oryzae TaxID=2675220 RepID=UPI0012E25A7A|nr:hypothetical protein [Sandarakinorhabdus oryzae]
MRIVITFIAALAVAGPALAGITVGATVKDTSGGIVGTIVSTADGNAVVDTGTNKVTIPLTSFGDRPEGPLLAMTKSQLDAAADQAAAARKQALANAIKPDAEVHGSQGAVIGTITKLDGDSVIIKGEAGLARIPTSELYMKADGLHFGMNAAQFEAAVKASMASEGTPS